MQQQFGGPTDDGGEHVATGRCVHRRIVRIVRSTVERGGVGHGTVEHRGAEHIGPDDDYIEHRGVDHDVRRDSREQSIDHGDAG